MLEVKIEVKTDKYFMKTIKKANSMYVVHVPKEYVNKVLCGVPLTKEVKMSMEQEDGKTIFKFENAIIFTNIGKEQGGSARFNVNSIYKGCDIIIFPFENFNQ